LAGVTLSPYAFAQTTQTFGTEQTYDVADTINAFGIDPVFNWSTGDLLTASFSGSTPSGGIGGFIGKEDQVIIPEIKYVSPAVTADTRTGARLDASIDITAGIELSGDIDFSNADINGSLGLTPSLTFNDSVQAGQFNTLQGSTVFASGSTFQTGLPTLGFGMELILQADFDATVSAAVPFLLDYTTVNFNQSIDTRAELFQFDIDLAASQNGGSANSIFNVVLPDVPILSDVENEIAAQFESDPEDTLYKVDIGNLGDISLGELQLVNPVTSLSTPQTTINGNTLEVKTRGDLLRLGADIDAILIGAFGLPPVTGSSIDFGDEDDPWASLEYDLLDIKYGPELSAQTRTSVTPELNATLTFDREVLIRVDGALQTTDTWTGDWNDLPEIALLSQDDVNVSVDFTQMILNAEIAFDAVLSDYFEVRGLEAEFNFNAGALPVPLADVGPLLYKKFDPLGDGIAFDIFSQQFIAGNIDLGSFFDDSFTIQAAPLTEAYVLNDEATSLQSINFSEMGEASPLISIFGNALADKTLVIGTAPGGSVPQTRLDLDSFIFDDRDLNDRTLTFDGLVVLDHSRYTQLFADLNLNINFIENDGKIRFSGDRVELRNPGGVLAINGKGDISLSSDFLIVADLVTHGADHEIRFYSPARDYNGVVNAQLFDNAGQIRASGNERIIFNVETEFNNKAGALLFAEENSDLLFTDIFAFRNAGLVEVRDAGTTFDLTANRIFGSTDPNAPGWFIASGGARMKIAGSSGDPTTITARDNMIFQAISGGEIYFEHQVSVGDQFTLIVGENSEATLNGLALGNDQAQAQIFNHGTLEILDNSRLVIDSNNPDGGGSEFAIVTPIDLVNTGTINIRNDAEFEFNVRLDDFSNNGGRLEGGTWNIYGSFPGFGGFSNLDTEADPDRTTSIKINVVEIEQNGEILSLIDALNDGSDPSGFNDPLDVALKTNAANILLSGRALFPYLNTIENNEGGLSFAFGHQFTTAGTLNNNGGTINLRDTYTQLNVNGALVINGGTVTFSTQSRLEVTSDQITLNDGTVVTRSVDVNGGNLIFEDELTTLFNSSMFEVLSEQSELLTDENGFYYGETVVNLQLNEGQVWAVREGVQFDPVTGEQTTTPGIISMNGSRSGVLPFPGGGGYTDFLMPVIQTNLGTIIFEGQQAQWAAGERVLNNHGTLRISNGFTYGNDISQFGNIGTLDIKAAQFIMQDGSLFVNVGDIIMDNDAYLRADTFANSGNIQLDGLLETRTLTNSASGVITGSGKILGFISNSGLIDIGNSPGIIEVFDSFTLLDTATTRIEIFGNEPGTSFDQLFVRQRVAEEGDTPFYTVTTSLAGTLELVFAPEFTPGFSEEWMIIINEGRVTGEFDAIATQGLVASTDPDSFLAYRINDSDVLLGELNGYGIFYNPTAGDGNDIAVYSVPEPTSLALLGIGAFFLTRRRCA
jgi:hypothetical protein